MNGRRGFSLVEALLALFLFGLVLVIIGDLVNGYRNLSSHSQGRGRTLRSAEAVLSQIRADVRSATRVISLSPDFELERLRPELSSRLPDPIPAVLPPTWNVLQPSDLYHLKYRKVDDRLEREVGGQNFVVAAGVDSFSVEAVGTRYQVTLKIKERTKTTQLVTRMSRP